MRDELKLPRMPLSVWRELIDPLRAFEADVAEAHSLNGPQWDALRYGFVHGFLLASPRLVVAIWVWNNCHAS